MCVGSALAFADVWNHPVFLFIGAMTAVLSLFGVVWTMLRTLLTRPKVRFEAADAPIGDGSGLWCYFFNDQLVGGLYSILNIKRQAIEEFFVFVNLWTARGEYIGELDVALHDRHLRHDDTHALPPSVHPLCGVVAVSDEAGTCVLPVSTHVKTYLLPDTYEIRVLLHADEVDIRVMGQRFIVTDDGANWVGEPYRLKKNKQRPRGRQVLMHEVGPSVDSDARTS